MSDFLPIHIGDTVSDNQVHRVFVGLCDRSLPKREWTHGAHLCAGVAMVTELGLPAAETQMPDCIRAYNVAVGGKNTDTEGYHHTITLFYLRVLSNFLVPIVQKGIGFRASAVLASDIADKNMPLKYYSRERLFSTTARQEWLAPDLCSLPEC